MSHGGLKRARSWKQRIQPKEAYSSPGLLYSETCANAVHDSYLKRRVFAFQDLHAARDFGLKVGTSVADETLSVEPQTGHASRWAS
jgi:hypothetical protein